MRERKQKKEWNLGVIAGPVMTVIFAVCAVIDKPHPEKGFYAIAARPDALASFAKDIVACCLAGMVSFVLYTAMRKGDARESASGDPWLAYSTRQALAEIGGAIVGSAVIGLILLLMAWIIIRIS